VSLQSLKEQFDQSPRVVARVTVASDAEVPDAAHQLVGLRAGPDVTSVNRGAQQLCADGFQAVEKVGVQRAKRLLSDCKAPASPCLVTKKSTKRSIH
jgi:hypothetical protein